MSHWHKVDPWLMALTTKDARYIIVLGIVISVLPISSTAQTQTCWVGIWILLASATTHFGHQKASHYISLSHPWSMIEWQISNARYSKQVSGLLTISSRVMRWGSTSEEGVQTALETVSKVGRPGEYICGLGEVILIRQHHLGCNSARKQFL